MNNCYETDREPGPERWRQELDGAAFDAWLKGLASHGMLQNLVALLTKLDRMYRVELEVGRRLSLMHRLMPTVRDVSDDLPKHRGAIGGAKSESGEALSLEQRLLCLAVRNLKVTLAGLDGKGGVQVPGRNAARLWVMKELFDCLGRQIELGARWQKPLPLRTWQELHDLYAYFVDRLRPAVDSVEATGVEGTGVDLDLAYKRLLLIGLVAAQGAGTLLRERAGERVLGWARRCELRVVASETGELGGYMVEMSRDAPPRRNLGGGQDSVRRAMVLRPPSDLISALDAVAKGKPVFLSE